MVANYATVLVFGLGFALMMYELSSRVQRPFFVIIYLPYIISGLGVGMFIDLLFSQTSGSLNLLLQDLNLVREPLNLKSSEGSFWALVLFVGWRFAGFNMAIFLSGLLTIPTETIEAAKMDGASYYQRFRHIYVPQIVPSLGIATIACLVGSFGIFDETVGFGALYGNNNARLFAVVLFGMGSGALGSSGKLSEGVAASVVVFLPLIVLAYFIFRWQKRHQEY
jgi:ABC-type sugar transport system permease subunit